MPGPRRDETGFRHGLRVRMGATGPKGTLLRCTKRDGGHYWKVRLRQGEWIFPDGLVIDGPGDHLEPACLECRLPFIGNRGDLLCGPCQRDHFGETFQRARDARDESFARQRMSRTFHRRRSHS